MTPQLLNQINKIRETELYEGQFTCWKSVRDFFRTKGFMQIFDEFFLKTKGFLPEVYEIFWSEMPLGTLDLPFFFHLKHLTSLKNLPSPAPNEISPYWFQGNFAASFVLNFCLREFLLSAFANRFESRCEPKRLMLLYYKICPCCRKIQNPSLHCF